MSRLVKLTIVILGVLLSFGFCFSAYYIKVADAAKEEKSCIDVGCHDQLVTEKVIHPILEDGTCDACHVQVRKKHPHKRKKSFELTKPVSELCYDCHEQAYSEGIVHQPVASGECTSCHNPHSSEHEMLLQAEIPALCYFCHDSEPFTKSSVHPIMADGGCNNCHGTHNAPKPNLLIEDGNALCVMCHPDVEEGYKAAKSKHMALEGNCTDCHLPHSADVSNLLSAPMPEICFYCHDRALFDGVKYKHGPVVSDPFCANCHSPHFAEHDNLLFAEPNELCLMCHSGELTSTDGKTIQNIQGILEKGGNKHAALDMGGCSVCHMAHGGEYPELLNSAYPSGDYARYKTEAYGLCFNCHDSAAFDNADPGTTGFKKGGVNLHYLHVSKPRKGRSCQMCHGVHAAAYPHLIQDKMPFGNWQITIKYSKRKDGSKKCLVYCHDPQTYK